MNFRTAWVVAGVYNAAALIFSILLLAALDLDRAEAASYPAGAHWRQAPAWTVTVPPYGGVRSIPASVCPFGISDLAATRGRREYPAPRVDTLAFAGRRLIVNGSARTLRAWVWCG